MTVYREPPTGSNMGTRLVTVATFDQVVQARMAADALRAGGIDAAVADAETVSMDWLLSNAIGGIKVQVRDEDADQAVAELSRTFGEGGEGFGARPAAAAADGASDAPADDEPDPNAGPPLDFRLGPEDEIPPPPSPYSRDGYARRVVLASWLGIVFPPAWFVAFYFFLNALFGEGELSGRGRFNLVLAVVVLLVGMPLAYIFFMMLAFGL
jgi:hypothetical protein